MSYSVVHVNFYMCESKHQVRIENVVFGQCQHSPRVVGEMPTNKILSNAYIRCRTNAVSPLKD